MYNLNQCPVVSDMNENKYLSINLCIYDYSIKDIDQIFLKFKEVWKKDITEKTKTIIWKYLQLICFTIINDVKDAGSFGDTAHLFEAIDEDELKSKLEETMEQMAIT